MKIVFAPNGLSCSVLLLALGLVGCSGISGGTESPSVESAPPTVASQPVATSTPQSAPTGISAPPASQPVGGEYENLDLREANVIDVQFERLEDGRLRFDVTMIHDDDGEAPEFADWWQVEDLQGNLLGERILLHSHGTTPFTRSQTVSIPSDIQVVRVRGHDMRHGFGGQAMQVDLETGMLMPIDEGSDPQ